jgi:hypothetical protein
MVPSHSPLIQNRESVGHHGLRRYDFFTTENTEITEPISFSLHRVFRVLRGELNTRTPSRLDISFYETRHLWGGAEFAGRSTFWPCFAVVMGT